MIYKYEIVKPVTNRKLPYLDDRGVFIVPNARTMYNYYIEVKRYNPNTLCYEYFILLGTDKFDEQCRKCRVDDYCRLKVILHGEVLDFVISEMKNRGNVQFEYYETEDNYDVWRIV